MGCASRVAVVAVLLLGILSVAVDSADTRILKGPDCRGHSKDKEYNKRMKTLLDIFVSDTKNVGRHHGDYVYTHSFPNSDKGSVTGQAICDSHLWKWGCGKCLGDASKYIHRNCGSTLNATIILVDCSISVHKI
ncbi:unnamed protein product [Linum trigynum]|uniref:Gnk2-homologous domain-containing protein n=1 Tax=Linum trigynum TaxID=586398 RepID=A0AAV2E9P7_9ROSI